VSQVWKFGTHESMRFQVPTECPARTFFSQQWTGLCCLHHMALLGLINETNYIQAGLPWTSAMSCFRWDCPSQRHVTAEFPTETQ